LLVAACNSVSFKDLSRRNEHHARVAAYRESGDKVRFGTLAGFAEFVGCTLRLVLLERFARKGQDRKTVPARQVENVLMTCNRCVGRTLPDTRPRF